MNSCLAQKEFIISNYQLNVSELFRNFAQYDQLYFFCPKFSRSIVESAIKMVIDDICNYNPSHSERNLMTDVNIDIELYQSKKSHPSLEDSDFLNYLEIVTDQIEEQVDLFIRNKLPINQQFHIINPKWLGDNLIFGLRLF